MRNLVIYLKMRRKKICVNTYEQYMNDMKTHGKSHRVVDQNYVNNVTKKYNAMCKSIVRIVGGGKNV